MAKDFARRPFVTTLDVHGASLLARRGFLSVANSQPGSSGQDTHLRTCTADRDVPRESREKQ